MIKKHLKPTKENKGGIISKENFIHISNIKNTDLTKTKKEAKKMTPRLKVQFEKNIVNSLMSKLSYKNKIKFQKY